MENGCALTAFSAHDVRRVIEMGSIKTQIWGSELTWISLKTVVVFYLTNSLLYFGMFQFLSFSDPWIIFYGSAFWPTIFHFDTLFLSFAFIGLLAATASNYYMARRHDTGER